MNLETDSRWAGDIDDVGDDVVRPRLRVVGRVGLIEVRGAVKPAT